MKKIIVFILLFATIMLTGGYQAKAIGPDDIIKKGDDFINQGDPSKVVSKDNIKDTSGMVFRVLLFIGIIVAIIAGIIIGMQFVTGSVEAKAQVKEKLIPYVVGCIIIFGAFGIWKLVVDLLQGVNW